MKNFLSGVIQVEYFVWKSHTLSRKGNRVDPVLPDSDLRYHLVMHRMGRTGVVARLQREPEQNKEDYTH